MEKKDGKERKSGGGGKGKKKERGGGWIQAVRGVWVLRRIGPHTKNARSK